MNKHGQTLILFVILIPIILMLLAVVVDIGLVIGNRIKIEEVTKDILTDAYLLDDAKILESFKKNKIDNDKVNINREDDKIKIEIKEEIESIFGSIVGIKKYDIKVSVTALLRDGKVNFE